MVFGVSVQISPDESDDHLFILVLIFILRVSAALCQECYYSCCSNYQCCDAAYSRLAYACLRCFRIREVRSSVSLSSVSTFCERCSSVIEVYYVCRRVGICVCVCRCVSCRVCRCISCRVVRVRIVRVGRSRIVVRRSSVVCRSAVLGV